jgi:hypothetical protein
VIISVVSVAHADNTMSMSRWLVYCHFLALKSLKEVDFFPIKTDLLPLYYSDVNGFPYTIDRLKNCTNGDYVGTGY